MWGVCSSVFVLSKRDFDGVVSPLGFLVLLEPSKELSSSLLSLSYVLSLTLRMRYGVTISVVDGLCSFFTLLYTDRFDLIVDV